jgi:hypothetical protein
MCALLGKIPGYASLPACSIHHLGHWSNVWDDEYCTPEAMRTRGRSSVFFQDVVIDDMKAPAEKDAKYTRRFRVCEQVMRRRLGRQSAVLWRGAGTNMSYAIFHMKYGI